MTLARCAAIIGQSHAADPDGKWLCVSVLTTMGPARVVVGSGLGAVTILTRAVVSPALARQLLGDGCVVIARDTDVTTWATPWVGVA